MKKILIAIALCTVTFMSGYWLSLIFNDYQPLLMFWAGMAYLGSLKIIGLKSIIATKNKRWTDVLPANSYVLFTPDDGMFISPDPEDIQRAIFISKGIS